MANHWYTIKPPRLIKALYRELDWKVQTSAKELFLTFDDGPVPGITPEVLKILKAYNAKATFFCIGRNVENNPEIYKAILDDGHATGNHTYNHLNGWKTKDFPYLKNTLECAERVESDLFRPPYGKITRSQAKALKSRFRIIMWDVLSGDFDKNCTKEKCLTNVINCSSPGSIIVFHDSIKASEKVFYSLPKILEHFGNRGYTFSGLNSSRF